MKMETMLSWVQVSDHAQAKKFYGEVLGLKKVFEMDGWAEFSHAPGATSIGVALERPERGATSGATIVLRVNDLDRARAELSKRGVEFEGEIEEVPGVVRIATFRDPFGNPLQLAQPLVEA